MNGVKSFQITQKWCSKASIYKYTNARHNEVCVNLKKPTKKLWTSIKKFMNGSLAGKSGFYENVIS